MKARKGIIKELHSLLQDIAGLTDNQCTILEILGEENLKKTVKFLVEVKPNSGAYQGGKFDFLFKVSHRYPIIAPEVLCLTQIYHPNIDDCGEICLSLFEDWAPEYNTLHDCVHGLLFLFNHPNLEDPLSPYFCPEDANDAEMFLKNVRKSLEGGSVEGFKFPRNLPGTSDNDKSTQHGGIAEFGSSEPKEYPKLKASHPLPDLL